MALPEVVLSKSTIKPTNSFSSVFAPLKSVKNSNIDLIFEKGTVITTPTFRDDEGEFTVPHPDKGWDLYQQIYQKIPIAKIAVDHTANFGIQSGYELEGSAKAVEAVEKWRDAVNFDLMIKDAMLQAQIYGNAFLEITDIQSPKFLPVNTMFVVTNKGGDSDGVVKGYKQVINSVEDATPFTLDEIVHFKWNNESGYNNSGYYGLSEMKTASSTLRRILNYQDNLGEILRRHAEPVIHWTIGSETSPGTSDQLNTFKGNLATRGAGGDLITSWGIEGKSLAADLRMIQPDGILTHLENQLIAAFQIPAVFIRGGMNSNKATADVELQAFDRKVKALRVVISKFVEDFIFPKVTGGEKVKMLWNEPNFNTEATKAEMVERLVKSRIPAEVAFKIVGWQGYLDDLEAAGGQDEVMAPPMGNEDEEEPKEEPKEEDFKTQAEWIAARERYIRSCV